MSQLEFWTLIVDGVAAILAAVAILLYISFWYRDKANNSYTIFDQNYLEILKLGIEHPRFRDPAFTLDYQHTADREARIRYETYAFICWNFCETVFDKGDSDLMETWGVVIGTENGLHRKWFDQPENQVKFKDSFREYITKNFPKVH